MTEAEAFVRSFIVPRKRARLIELLANPKRRRDVRRTLPHFRDLDPRWIIPIRSGEHDAQSIERALRRLGARDFCHVISEDRVIDGQQLPLTVALHTVVSSFTGSLLSRVPGVLAYYEGEDLGANCILFRKTAT